MFVVGVGFQPSWEKRMAYRGWVLGEIREM